MKHQQIDATISQVSMFHMFLYIIAISLKLPQKVFWAAKGVRLFIVVGRQDYTNPGSSSFQSVYAACRNMLCAWHLINLSSHIVNSAGCWDVGWRSVQNSSLCLVDSPW